MENQQMRRVAIHWRRATLFTLIFAVGAVIVLRLGMQSMALAASVTSVNPLSAVAGDPDTTLTVIASDFDTGTVQVLWNGSALADVAVVDATTITAVVPSSYLATAGSATVVITDVLNGEIGSAIFTINNPSPSITAIDPLSAAAGAAFTVTVTGTGFVASSAVSLNSIPLTVIAQTGTTLTAVAGEGTFTSVGSYSIVVFNPGPGGGSDSIGFAITHGPLAAIQIVPNPLSLTVNTTATLAATGSDNYGNAVTPLTVDWSLLSGVGGIITPTGSSTAVYQAPTSAGSFAGGVLASTGSVTGAANLNVSAGPLASISIAPNPTTLVVSTTQLFTASGFDAYGNTVSPLSVSWSTSSSAAGQIESSGSQTAIFRAGIVVGPYADSVKASASGITGTASVTITAGPLARIDLTPPAVILPISTSQAYAAAGYDAYGNTISPLSVSWSVSPGAAGHIESSGDLTASFRTGTQAGPFLNSVIANSGSIVGTASVTVTPGAVSRIDLTPPAWSLPISTSHVFAAAGYDLYNNQISGLSMSWSAVASAGSIGTHGPLTATFVAGTTPGPYTDAVRATVSGITGSADITVEVGTIAQVVISPSVVTLQVSTTQLFTATTYDAAGNPLGLPVTWLPPSDGAIVSSSSITMLFRSGTSVGLFTDLVRAQQGAVIGAADVTVIAGPLASIRITPNGATLVVSTTQQFVAAGSDAYGNTISPLSVLWTVSPGITGQATPAGALTATFRSGILTGIYTDSVRASSGSITGTADVTVTPGVVSKINLTPPAVSLPISTSQVFTATAYDPYNNLISGLSMSWSAVAPAGSIGTHGPLTATFVAGTTPGPYVDSVRAAVSGITGTADITVQVGSIARVVISPSVTTLQVSTTQLFSAAAVDAAGNPLSLPITWLTPSGGTIVSSSSITMLLRAGTSVGLFSKGVQAQQGAITGTADVTVVAGPLASIRITPNGKTLVVSTTQQFVAAGSDAYGNTILPLTVTWTVAPSTAGQATPAGALTATFRAGTLTGIYTDSVRASSGSISGTADITVTPGALSRIGLVPQAVSLPISTSQIFTATGYDLYNNVISGLAMTWTAVSQAGAIGTHGPLTTTFRAGTIPGPYPGAVRAFTNNVTGTATVTVLVGPVARVVILPSAVTLQVSTTQLFTATTYDAAGNLLGLPVTWLPPSGGAIQSSSSITMLFRAGTSVGNFATAVQAQRGAIIGTAGVTVVAGPLDKISLTPNILMLPISGTTTITAIGKDAYDNQVPSLSVVWSYNNAVVSIVASSSTTATFRAGQLARQYLGVITATQGTVRSNADVTVVADPPGVVELHATPGLIRTDGVNTSTVVMSVTDIFGNAIDSSAQVTLSLACPGTCQVTPSSGNTTNDGLFTATLKSNYRAVTQTINSLIRVTAIVTGPSGFITGGVDVSGTFTPTRTFLPMAIDNVFRNHTACAALTVTPPTTVTQPADNNYNIYRFVATTKSYNLILKNYPAKGRLFIYQILADNCASSTTMNLKVITSTATFTKTALYQWSVNNVFTSGLSYLALVYNEALSSTNYTLSFLPKAALELQQEGNADTSDVANSTWDELDRSGGLPLQVTPGPTPIHEATKKQRTF